MFVNIRSTVGWLNDQALWIFLAGIVVILIFHLLKWQDDRSIVIRLKEKRKLPYQPISTEKCVSVLVPAWNESRLIARQIESFLNLRYPNKELIICAGGQDNTYEIACQYAGKQVIVLRQESEEGKQKALRKCLAKAMGEIIFLVDADGKLDNESFERTLAPLIEEKASASSGSTCPLPEQISNPFVLYQWFAEHYSTRLLGEYTLLLRGCNSAVYRSVLENAGGFGESVRIGTDDHLSIKLQQQGARIRFVRASQVKNDYPIDFQSYLRQQTRWLRVAYYRSFCRLDHLAFMTWLNFLVNISPAILVLLGLFFGRFFLSTALLLVLFMFGTRIRVTLFGSSYLEVRFPWAAMPDLLLYMLVDSCVRIIGLIQLIISRSRYHW